MSDRPGVSPAAARARASLSGLRDSGKADYTRRGKRRRRKEWVIFNRDEFRCVYCGKSSIEDGVKLEADHVIARSAGGKDVAGNLVTACRGCNRSKFDGELEGDAPNRLLGLVAERNAARRIHPELPVDLGRSPLKEREQEHPDPRDEVSLDPVADSAVVSDSEVASEEA